MGDGRICGACGGIGSAELAEIATLRLAEIGRLFDENDRLQAEVLRLTDLLREVVYEASELTDFVLRLTDLLREVVYEASELTTDFVAEAVEKAKSRCKEDVPAAPHIVHLYHNESPLRTLCGVVPRELPQYLGPPPSDFRAIQCALCAAEARRG